jgi:hypothetical protein
VNTAVVAPTARAMTSMEAAANNGFRIRMRTPRRRSLRNV